MSGRDQDPVGSHPEAAPRRLGEAARTDRGLLAASSLTIFSRGFAKLAQLAFLIVAARLLEVTEFAGFSYLVVLALTFASIADTGAALVAGRDVSAGRGDPPTAFWSGLPIAAVSGLVGAALLVGFGLLDGGPGTSGPSLSLAVAFVAVNMVFNFNATMLRAVGRFRFEAALQAAGAAAFVAAGALCAALGLGVTGVLCALLAKEVTSVLVAYMGLREDVGAPLRPSPLWRKLLVSGIALAIASSLLAVALRVHLTVLANTGTNAEVAWFSAPLRVAESCFVLATTAGYALLPGLSWLVVQDPVRARRLIRRVLTWAVATGAGLAAIAVPLASPLMKILFGSDFAPAADPARLLLAGIGAYAVLGIAWYALVALDRGRDVLRVGLTGAVTGVAASMLLIPRWGDVGAAVSFLVTFVSMAALSVARLVGVLAVSPEPRLTTA